MAIALTELQRSRGEVHLRLKQRDGVTRLADLYQSGCLKVRFPGTPHPGPSEAVLINTAGGLTDGDVLSMAIDWDDETLGLVTTQAAERVYRCREAPARIETSLTVGANATACWLPQESILFDNSRLERRTHIHLDTAARLFAVESLVFGRTAMGERVQAGCLYDQMRVWQCGKLSFADALHIDGDEDESIHEVLQRRSTLGGKRCAATVVFAGCTEATIITLIRTLIDESSVAGGASDLGTIIVMRLLAEDSKSLRELVLQLYAACLGGAGFLEPRVWHC